LTPGQYDQFNGPNQRKLLLDSNLHSSINKHKVGLISVTLLPEALERTCFFANNESDGVMNQWWQKCNHRFWCPDLQTENVTVQF
jgi:hypothetical protein